MGRIYRNWFPHIRADIFISHSHKDEQDVIALAGILKEQFDLNVFIDSCVWGYADVLLKRIDDKYCKIADNVYDYEKSNRSASHIYMMLSTALLIMIDNTECVFFYNTPNSLSPEETIRNKTASPWIYSELNISRLIKKDKAYHRREISVESIVSFSALSIKYTADTSHLKALDKPLFLNWIKEIRDVEKSGKDALDMLYEITGVEE